MKRLLGILLSLIIIPTFALTPLPIYQAKQNIEQYVESGQYAKDISVPVLEAKTYLEKRIAKNHGEKKLAVVFDIDETLLSNYASIKEEDFASTKASIDYEMSRTNPKAITPSLDLYNFAKKNGVAVFLITGRHETLRQDTIEALHNAGYADWTHLYLEPNDQHFKSAADFKAPIRQQLEQEGYDVVLTVGDQESDLAGGYAEKKVKLPNPFYFVP